MQIGDIVKRQNIKEDSLFTIKTIRPNNICELHALGARFWAESPLEALRPAKVEQVQGEARHFRQTLDGRVAKALSNREAVPQGAFFLPGRVLHVDADAEYLRICAQTYARLQVPNACIPVAEEWQATQIDDLLEMYRPNILVLTGHDALLNREAPADVEQYKSTLHFIRAVRQARRFQSSRDGLAIIAGACQSHFEGLMEAGANVASAPDRIRIHALDPLLVAEKIAYTPIGTILAAEALAAAGITGLRGIGGCQTRGMLRIGAPG